MLINAADSFTRPADTNAYADGDLVANSTTAGSVVPLSFSVSRLKVGSGIIRAARIFKDNQVTTNATFTVHLFSQSPSVTNGDNGAFLPTTVEYWLGSIPVDLATNGVASGTDAVARGAPSAEINFDLWGFNATERRLYALLEAGAAYTPASAEIFSVVLEIMNGNSDV